MNRAHQENPQNEHGDPEAINRRDFMKFAAAAVLSLLTLPTLPSVLSGCSSRTNEERPSRCWVNTENKVGAEPHVEGWPELEAAIGQETVGQRGEETIQLFRLPRDMSFQNLYVLADKKQANEEQINELKRAIKALWFMPKIFAGFLVAKGPSGFPFGSAGSIEYDTAKIDSTEVVNLWRGMSWTALIYLLKASLGADQVIKHLDGLNLFAEHYFANDQETNPKNVLTRIAMIPRKLDEETQGMIDALTDLDDEMISLDQLRYPFVRLSVVNFSSYTLIIQYIDINGHEKRKDININKQTAEELAQGIGNLRLWFIPGGSNKRIGGSFAWGFKRGGEVIFLNPNNEKVIFRRKVHDSKRWLTDVTDKVERMQNEGVHQVFKFGLQDPFKTLTRIMHFSSLCQYADEHCFMVPSDENLKIILAEEGIKATENGSHSYPWGVVLKDLPVYKAQSVAGKFLKKSRWELGEVIGQLHEGDFLRAEEVIVKNGESYVVMARSKNKSKTTFYVMKLADLQNGGAIVFDKTPVEKMAIAAKKMLPYVALMLADNLTGGIASEIVGKTAVRISKQAIKGGKSLAKPVAKSLAELLKFLEVMTR